jgi:hypothetical protein
MSFLWKEKGLRVRRCGTLRQLQRNVLVHFNLELIAVQMVLDRAGG